MGFYKCLDQGLLWVFLSFPNRGFYVGSTIPAPYLFIREGVGEGQRTCLLQSGGISIHLDLRERAGFARRSWTLNRMQGLVGILNYFVGKKLNVFYVWGEVNRSLLSGRAD